MAELVDLVVNRRVFLDEGIGGGEVRFGLVIVVVRDEVFYSVIGKQLLELTVELGSKGLVGRQHQGRAVLRGNDVGYGEGLARTGDAEEYLIAVATAEPFDQFGDGLGLVTLGGVG